MTSQYAAVTPTPPNSAYVTVIFHFSLSLPVYRTDSDNNITEIDKWLLAGRT